MANVFMLKVVVRQRAGWRQATSLLVPHIYIVPTRGIQSDCQFYCGPPFKHGGGGGVEIDKGREVRLYRYMSLSWELELWHCLICQHPQKTYLIQMTLVTRSAMKSIISSCGLGLPLTAIYSAKVGPTFC